MRLSQRLPPLALGLLIACSGCGTTDVVQVATPVVPAVSVWAGAWGAAPANADTTLQNSGGTDQTFRFLINPTLSGTQERLRFSNFFGATPITIGGARLAIGKDGTAAVDPANNLPVTFSGASSVTLQPGQILLSDNVALSYKFGQTLAVSVYIKGTFPSLTRHDSLFIDNYATANGAGDMTADSAGTSFVDVKRDWLLLSGLDVYGDYQGTVILLGSSTTDGYKADFGNTNAYPIANQPLPDQHTARLSDQLAKILNAAGIRLGVVNAGISGNTLTPASNANVTHLQDGLDRFDRDVAQQTNVKIVVDYLGAIDLRSLDCKSAAVIEGGVQQLVTKAAAYKLPVILATLPPSAFCVNPAQPNYGPSPTPAEPYNGGPTPGPQNGAERERLLYNAWLKTSGVALPGVVGLADLDQALADPAHPGFMLPHLNSGDNFHPNGAGYAAEAAAIPLSLLQAAAK